MTASTTSLQAGLVQARTANQLAEVLAPPEVVDAVALQLRRVKNLKQLEMALLSGELIVNELYDGDPANLAKRDPRKAGLRVLAAHPAVDVGASTLHAYVAVYALTRRLQLVDTRKDKLSYSHYRTVLAAPEGQQQQLLERAADNGWTVLELRKEAGLSVPPPKAAVQQTGGGSAARVVKAFKRTLGQQKAAMASDGLTQGLTERRAKALAQDVDEVIAALQALKAKLQAPEVPLPTEAKAPKPTPARRQSTKPTPTAVVKAATAAKPVVKTPRTAARSQQPTRRTGQGLSAAEARLEADAVAAWRVVEQVLATGITRERVAPVIARKARVSTAFAERMAKLADVQQSIRDRLKRWPKGRQPPSLTQILKTAKRE